MRIVGGGPPTRKDLRTRPTRPWPRSCGGGGGGGGKGLLTHSPSRLGWGASLPASSLLANCGKCEGMRSKIGRFAARGELCSHLIARRRQGGRGWGSGERGGLAWVRAMETVGRLGQSQPSARACTAGRGWTARRQTLLGKEATGQPGDAYTRTHTHTQSARRRPASKEVSENGLKRRRASGGGLCARTRTRAQAGVCVWVCLSAFAA
jgi:hypothetical protein